MRCGWCETNNPSDRSGCVNCGGPLPLAPSPDLGPEPPPVPRALPEVFVRRVSYARNSNLRFGVAFGAVGALASLGFVVGTVVFPPMAGGLCIGLLFVAVGAGIARSGWRSGQARLDVLRAGASTVGRVASVREEGTDSAGRPRWHLAYTFEVGERTHQGGITCGDAEVTRFAPGWPVRVVFRPDDPTHNDIWPLLA